MTDKKTRFGRALNEALRAQGLSQVDAAERLSVSPNYVSAIATGRKGVSPARIDRMAETLDLAETESRRLHRAAALDAGFRLDLPDDF